LLQQNAELPQNYNAETPLSSICCGFVVKHAVQQIIKVVELGHNVNKPLIQAAIPQKAHAMNCSSK